MDLTVVKEICNTVAQLGGDAKTVFLAYCGYYVFNALLVFLSLLIIPVQIIKAISKAINNNDENANTLRRMRDYAGIGAPGNLNCNELYELEKQFVKMIDEQRTYASAEVPQAKVPAGPLRQYENKQE